VAGRWLWLADWNVSHESVANTGVVTAAWNPQMLLQEDMSLTSRSGSTLYDFAIACPFTAWVLAHLAWEPKSTWLSPRGLPVDLHKRACRTSM